MRLRPLLFACAALAAVLAVTGCVGDGGYGDGYGYDYGYYGPDVEFDDGFWGPAYYVGPGHFHGRYGPHRGRPAYRPAPGGRLPPSLPRGASRGGAVHGAPAPRGGGAVHGGGRGPRGH